jgi:hypothetical protein
VPAGSALRPKSHKSSHLNCARANVSKILVPRLFPVTPLCHHPSTRKIPICRLFVIGETGFEPATARPPAGCATRLRHSPWPSLSLRRSARPRSGPVIRPAWEHMFVTAQPVLTRTCGRCNRPKPLSDFAWRRKARGQRDNYCRQCRADYKREHYAKHRERYVANALGHKRFNIAKGVRDRNWQSVLDEIATCDVVCANCHRRRTARRAGFARAVVAQR